MPIWKVRAWLTSELAAAAHVGEIEGEGQGDEVRTRTPSRLVLRWCGEDSEDTKAVGAESIRPGDVIIVPSSYGGCDRWGRAPSSNIPVADLATTAAQPFWRQRVAVRFHPHFFPRELVLLASRLHAEVEGLAELKRQLLEIPNLPQTLQAEQGPTVLCLETTAGTGTALGRTFEELAELLEAILPSLRDRVGICVDTCHIFSAGYDLVNDFDGVIAEFDRILGLDRLRVWHLNDSKTPFNSHRDRHELIGEGSLGLVPFRRIMTDVRFAHTVRILETPKLDDATRTDRLMLNRLMALASIG